MFKSHFDQLEKRINGFKAAVVVSPDGIEIDSRVNSEYSHEILSAELNTILQHLDRLKEDVEIGLYEEVVIKTDQENIIMVRLSKEAFMLLITEKKEPTGHAIYEVQRLAPEFMAILS